MNAKHIVKGLIKEYTQKFGVNEDKDDIFDYIVNRVITDYPNMSSKDKSEICYNFNIFME